MNALGVWGQFFSMAILGLVLWAAVSDLLFRRIPNAAVVSIVLVEAAALAAAALGGNGGAALGLLQSGSVWAVGVLIAGFLLYLTGRMGAGDVKLAAVLSFWAGSEALLFLILLSLVGGLMVLGLPILRMILILVNIFFIMITRHSKRGLFSLMQTVLWIMNRLEKKFISV